MFLCKPFCCRPEASAEGSPWGRRPERSEGCLAIARQDKKWGLGRTKQGDFFEQPQLPHNLRVFFILAEPIEQSSKIRRIKNMYLPKSPDFESKKALIIAPQPELNFFKHYLPLDLITTYLGVRIFRRGNTLVCGPLFSAQMAGFLYELLARAKVREVLFLGWGGALNKAFNKGELFVPTRAYSKLGLTKELYPKRRTFYPSGKLLSQA
jgi:hypothetical protein